MSFHSRVRPAFGRVFFLFTAPTALPFHAGYPGDSATATLNASLGALEQNTDGHAHDGEQGDDETDDEDFHARSTGTPGFG